MVSYVNKNPNQPILLKADIGDTFGDSAPVSISSLRRGGEFIPDTGLNLGIPASGPASLSDYYQTGTLPSITNVYSGGGGTIALTSLSSNPNKALVMVVGHYTTANFTANIPTPTITNGSIIYANSQKRSGDDDTHAAIFAAWLGSFTSTTVTTDGRDSWSFYVIENAYEPYFTTPFDAAVQLSSSAVVINTPALGCAFAAGSVTSSLTNLDNSLVRSGCQSGADYSTPGGSVSYGASSRITIAASFRF